jgi:hypothetical protein
VNQGMIQGRSAFVYVLQLPINVNEGSLNDLLQSLFIDFFNGNSLELLVSKNAVDSFKEGNTEKSQFIDFVKSSLPGLENFLLSKNAALDNSRVEFIHRHIEEIQKQLVSIGSTIQTFYGNPIDVFKQLIADNTIVNVYTNHDYEPYATKRDLTIRELLKNAGIDLICSMGKVTFPIWVLLRLFSLLRAVTITSCEVVPAGVSSMLMIVSDCKFISNSVV